MAGLLAGRMLARRNPTIHEVAPSLPNNHSAVLRFRTSVVGDVAGIPFRKVSMIRSALPWKNPVADALAYSYKNTGVRRSDRSIASGDVAAPRWIAPSDFILQLSLGTRILFDVPPNRINDMAKGVQTPIISTIPMPTLMRALDYPSPPAFDWRPAVNITAWIEDCDAFVSLLVPSPEFPFSRISITGNRLIIEVPGSTVMTPSDVVAAVDRATFLLGISPFAVHDPVARPATYAKALPIDDDVRREFMSWATDNFNVFSLGRFATWRPALLLDDLVNDIRLIDRWLDKPARRYAINRSR